MIEVICKNCGDKKVFNEDKKGKRYKCVCGSIVTVESIDVGKLMDDEISFQVEEMKYNVWDKMILGMSFNGIFVTWLVLGVIVFIVLLITAFIFDFTFYLKKVYIVTMLLLGTYMYYTKKYKFKR